MRRHKLAIVIALAMSCTPMESSIEQDVVCYYPNGIACRPSDPATWCQTQCGDITSYCPDYTLAEWQRCSDRRLWVTWCDDPYTLNFCDVNGMPCVYHKCELGAPP